jgi:hypothetical protein
VDVEAKAKGQSTGFFETEVARRTDCFGSVCQLFSTYASRHAPGDDKPFMRGINSIQIVNDGHRWWIASVVWDSERQDNPIPRSTTRARRCRTSTRRRTSQARRRMSC